MTDPVVRSADGLGAGRGGPERAACLLGGLAGLLYNSWPLGFALDPAALHGTYLSVLEIPGRPYARLFVACDLAAGVLAVLAGVLLLRRPQVAAGLGMFGVGNVWGASIPINASCATSVAACGAAPGQLLEPHTMASILSAAGLVLALWDRWQHGTWMRALIGAGAFAGLFLLVSVLTARWVVESQAVFLVACGVVLAGVPLACSARVRDQA